MTNRGDVNGIQLDDLKNTLTPDGEDNCNQGVTQKMGNRGYPWQDSPLSKRWTKTPTTLNALRAGKRLIEE